MKGIIIYEDYRGKEVVEAIKLGMVNYECKSDTSDGSWINNLSGVRKEVTQAYCNEKDTYDFEIGALIALMKMCGVDKVVRACNEAFSEDTFKTYATKYERELNTLKHEYDLCKNSENALKCSVAYLNKTIAKLNMAIDGYKNDLYKVSNKLPTKREEMWANIVGASQDPPVDIKVAKQDIRAFLKELQEHIPKARWNGSDCLPTEYTNPYWFKHDYIYFALFRYVSKGDLRICYDECKHTWISKPVIEYIAPMRWDLFKKGHLAVKVTYRNYKEFYEACEKEFGKRPVTAVFTEDFTVSICKKDGFFEIFTIEDQKKSGKKIVDWEDVR